MGPFAGWLMPIEYEGALAEHRAVRERVGLFDLTHLGKVEVTGPGALGMLQRVVTNDLSKAAVGEAKYNLVLNEGGGVIEDLIVYRLAAERYFVVPNAANAQRVLQVLEEEQAEAASTWCITRTGASSPCRARVGAGGRRSCSPRRPTSAFMQCVETQYRRRPVILTRSGYTGEVGFELFTYQDVARRCGASSRRPRHLRRGAVRAGGARRPPPGDGLPALRPGPVRVRDGPRGRAVVGGQLRQGRVPRARGPGPAARRRAAQPAPRAPDGGAAAHPPRALPGDARRRLIGEVTSGTFSPILQTGIGLAYLWPDDVADVGDGVEVDVRGRRGAATVVRPPFVDRKPARAQPAQAAPSAAAMKSWTPAPPNVVPRRSVRNGAVRRRESGGTATTT